MIATSRFTKNTTMPKKAKTQQCETVRIQQYETANIRQKLSK
jgi:hypothetical protein